MSTSTSIGSAPSTSEEEMPSSLLENLTDRFRKSQMKRNRDGEPLAELDVALTAEEVYKVCSIAVESFKQQPALLRISSEFLPLTVIGDLHGQLRDIRLIFEHFGHVNQRNFLFLGDYADRGVQGVEVICFLLVNKIRFPSKCFMLRGNHEDYNISMVYGLLDECLMKYGEKIGQRVWLSLVNVFNHMPFAALIGEKIYAAHGGISPEIDLVEDINRIVRPCLIPLYGLACDIVWSDPSPQYDGWALSSRGISFSYGDRVVEQFCRRNGLDLILRGHQISNDMHQTGYKFSHNNRVLTLFTASDYMHSQNTGATLTIQPDLRCQFTLFRPQRKRLLQTVALKRTGKSRAQQSSVVSKYSRRR
ncbi:Metallophosphoesterase domain containing protein [Aphelenchoides besseyi]|nr:Metallophosphoesterase domain containing protein [Aphelenchoides besseyi]KAI6193134.1 Metallophosphoesterase domain containing protein [Aphelenchoides besseyi]